MSAVEPSYALSGRVNGVRVVREPDVVPEGKISRSTADEHQRRRRRKHAVHAADQRLERVPVRWHVLQGRRRAGERAAPSDGHAHPVDARAQPGRGSAGARQPPLGRRASFPGG